MAAGLSIKRVHFERFARAFDAEVRRVVAPEALEQTIVTDGSLDESDLSLDLARRLRDGGPWGQAFPEPCFHDIFEVVSQRVVGGQHLKLVLKRGTRVLDAIAFRQPPIGAAQRVELVYRLAENDYGGNSTLQLMVEHLRVLA